MNGISSNIQSNINKKLIEIYESFTSLQEKWQLHNRNQRIDRNIQNNGKILKNSFLLMDDIF